MPPSPLPEPPVRTRRKLPRLLRRLHQRFRDVTVESWRRYRAPRAQAAYCDKFVAVTGSCGKTTATLLVERLLAATGAVVVGGRNHNAGRQLLRTMAGLRRPADFVVQEVSGHEPGAIAKLTDYLMVDVAVVTSIGHDHSTAFGVSYSEGPDAIAAEKVKLVEAVPPTGLACLNADDPRVAAMAGRAKARVVTYGRSEGAHIRATNVSGRYPGRLRFDLEVDGRVIPVATRFVGTIMLPNVLAALAVVHGLGRDLAAAAAALAEVEPEPQHMSVVEGASGRTWVLDTFKAPHWSTELLADDLAEIGGRGMLFVLGDMSDMRNGSSRRYGSVMRKAAATADRVILCGGAGSAMARAQREGYGNVAAGADLAEVARLIAAAPERLVILKANSKQHLERVVGLVEEAAATLATDTHHD